MNAKGFSHLLNALGHALSGAGAPEETPPQPARAHRYAGASSGKKKCCTAKRAKVAAAEAPPAVPAVPGRDE